RAKEQGRNNYQLYTPAMNARVLERLALENSLRHALQRDEFVLHYQPQFDVRNGRIVGVEALLRWQHPQRGLVLPGEFIPLAEETGLILPLGEWVLRTACAQHKAWQATGLPPLRVAVNLSARQFLQSNLVQVVVRTLNESGLDPRYLELEITESVASQNADFAILVLRELRDMGVRISVDDFGAGYSSLSYLKDFPIHTLKIDRSFVRDLTTDPNDAAIASAIIALAHSLGLNVVAEGVETEEQLAFLKERQCDEFQGYLLARPMPAETLQKMLARNGRPQRRPAVKLAP
ncbi:MAG: EAL domain-containing protein, partial [Chloroflexi bacterium]|nr:EAL domain-containing protein [Chloroflexota bacterium]